MVGAVVERADSKKITIYRKIGLWRRMNQKRGLILLLTIVLLTFSIINFILVTTTGITGRATNTAEGTASICISRLPSFTTIADQTATVETEYTLQVGVTFHGTNTSIRYLDNTSLFNINQSGYISFTPVTGDIGTHIILLTAEDTSDCAAMNATTTFQLTISAAGGAPPPAEAAPTPSVGDGGGGGGGGGAGQFGLAKVVPLHSFHVSEEEVKATVKQSQSVEKILTITNDGKVPLVFKLTNPLAIVSLFPKEFILQPGEQKRISLLINPQRDAIPDIYTGIITVAGGPLRKNIVLIIEIESDRVLFDGSIELRRTVLQPGDILEGTYTITGLLPGTVLVTYTISDLASNLYYLTDEKLTIENQVSFAKNIPLPKDIPPGEYLVAMRMRYGNSFATATEVFMVQSPPSALAGLAAPIAEIPLFTLAIPVMIIILLIILLLLYLLHRRVKRQNGSAQKVAGVSLTATMPQQSMAKTAAIPLPARKPIPDWDAALIQRKLSVLREGYQRGLINLETYRKSKETLEALLARANRLKEQKRGSPEVATKK